MAKDIEIVTSAIDEVLRKKIYYNNEPAKAAIVALSNMPQIDSEFRAILKNIVDTE